MRSWSGCRRRRARPVGKVPVEVSVIGRCAAIQCDRCSGANRQWIRTCDVGIRSDERSRSAPVDRETVGSAGVHNEDGIARSGSHIDLLHISIHSRNAAKSFAYIDRAGIHTCAGQCICTGRCRTSDQCPWAAGIGCIELEERKIDVVGLVGRQNIHGERSGSGAGPGIPNGIGLGDEQPGNTRSVVFIRVGATTAQVRHADRILIAELSCTVAIGCSGGWRCVIVDAQLKGSFIRCDGTDPDQIGCSLYQSAYVDLGVG